MKITVASSHLGFPISPLPRSGSAAFRSRSGSTPRSIRRKRCNWRRPANSWQSRRTSLEFPIAGSILHGLQPDGRVSADFGHLPMLFAMGSAFSPWVSLINNQWQIDMNRELNDTEILNMPVINHHWQPLVHHWMIHGTWRPAPRYPSASKTLTILFLQDSCLRCCQVVWESEKVPLHAILVQSEITQIQGGQDIYH